MECSSIFLFGCRSTDPQTSVDSTTDQQRTKKGTSAPSEPSVRSEEQSPPADLRADYDGPVSPEGYRLVKESNRGEPPPGKAFIPEYPPEEKERVEQTLAKMKAFIRQLEIIHGADYCRAANEAAPMDAWGSRLRVSCKAKFMGIVLGSAGPDRIDHSTDDMRWGIAKRSRGNYEGWTMNKDVWE